MSIEKIEGIIQEHEKRIIALEVILKKDKASKIKTGKKSLPDYIVELRDKGFFSKPKTAEEVHEKLEESYSCALNRVAVALIRLCARRALRKTYKMISGKSSIAYTW
ncbi:MAG: hypothetical protein PHI59_06865 [Candidatus Omnitrophica bacterium]|nr:hypothetical protein [Candidatus Omnitrophota bacterium]